MPLVRHKTFYPLSSTPQPIFGTGMRCSCYYFLCYRQQTNISDEALDEEVAMNVSNEVEENNDRLENVAEESDDSLNFEGQVINNETTMNHSESSSESDFEEEKVTNVMAISRESCDSSKSDSDSPVGYVDKDFNKSQNRTVMKKKLTNAKKKKLKQQSLQVIQPLGIISLSHSF